MPESNYLEPVRNHLTDAGKHLRMALSALDPKGTAVGHGDPAITLTIYGHVLQGMQDGAADCMDDTLG